MAFALGLFRWFLGSKLGNIAGLALLGLLALGAFKGYVAWERADAARTAREAYVAQQLAATQEESNRRLQVIDVARKNAERKADELSAVQADLAKALEEIDEKSRAFDRSVCLDPGAVDRLNGLRRVRAPAPPRRPPGLGTPGEPRDAGRPPDRALPGPGGHPQGPAVGR